jgi:hypothetical protein
LFPDSLQACIRRSFSFKNFPERIRQVGGLHD